MSDEAIIQSLLDTDFYKFTMGQLIFLRHPNVPVRYGYTKRTRSVDIAASVDEDALREQLDHVRTLRFTSQDIAYLRKCTNERGRIFCDEYLTFLAGLKLPPYELEPRGDTFHLQFPGWWHEAIYWETIGLSILTELHHRTLTSEFSWPERRALYADGLLQFQEKNALFLSTGAVQYVDFASRRRASRDWHETLIEEAVTKYPEAIIGTSNVYLARKYNLPPRGTFAHELPMGFYGIMHDSDEDIRASHHQALYEWWDLYGYPLSIALTDTYGTDFFFRDFTHEQARDWKGLRHDSGPPMPFGKKAIAFYKARGVDPRTKTIFFSDGLDAETMIQLALYFAGQFQVGFGWGTNLSNDLGFPPVSHVIKLIQAAGNWLVKLSDNPAKVTGPTEEVERSKRIFGYTAGTYEECRY